MGKKESFLQKTIFLTTLVFKIITPPVYSFPRLEKYCQRRIKKKSEAYLPRWFLAGLYKERHQYEDAKSVYSDLNALGYLSDPDRLSFGEVLFQLNDFQGALQVLAPIIDKYPRNKTANWHVGSSHVKLRQFKTAVPYLEKAISVGGTRPEEFWQLGFCYYHLGELQKAKENYYKALDGMAHSNELRQNLASVHIKIGQSVIDEDLDQAEAEFRSALGIHPGDTEAIKILEAVQAIRNNIQQADQLKRDQN